MAQRLKPKRDVVPDAALKGRSSTAFSTIYGRDDRLSLQHWRAACTVRPFGLLLRRGYGENSQLYARACDLFLGRSLVEIWARYWSRRSAGMRYCVSEFPLA